MHEAGTITENVARIRKQLPDRITLLAATKGMPLQQAKAAVAAGIRVLGENYVQEAEEKYAGARLSGSLGAELHLIGHLQRNKVSRALMVFDMIQTVDSFKLAVEISRKAEKPFPILVQVNAGEEKQKFGCLPELAAGLVEEISRLENVVIKGLMGVIPDVKDPEEARPYFRKMRWLFESLKEKGLPGVEMGILSMGMSSDYSVAIEEGSTMVRIGTGIFGKRRQKQAGG